MSTPAEDKLIAFLRKLQVGGLDGEPLSFITNIYSDRPRQDVARTGFPRIQVKELPPPDTRWVGMGATDRFYEIVLEVNIYVDMDTPLEESDVIDFWTEGRNLSPEEATGAIAYYIIKKVSENKGTLHDDNSDLFILKGGAVFKDKGIDNTYYHNLNIYKGSVTFNFLMRY